MCSHKYLPHTEDDLKAMLSVAGVHSLDDLYSDVPEALRLKREYDIPRGESEEGIREEFNTMASRNKRLVCFGGAGVYDHYVPAVADYIASRSEFLTSYTPYQAEISQGTLQYIFEY